MNVLARKYKPTPTATPRQQNSVANSRACPVEADSPSRSSEKLPECNAFDYEAEVRRLRSLANGPSTSVGYHVTQRDGQAEWIAPRVETSRFRWTQGSSADAVPPPERPQRVVTPAAKARNAMFRPVEQKVPDPADAPDWDQLTPAEKAARILGK